MFIHQEKQEHQTWLTDEVAVRVHYVDDESDRVIVSSDDELACALSFFPTTGGRPLRLFVSTTTVGAATQPVAVQPAQEEQNHSADVQPTTTSDAVEQPNDLEAKADAGEAAVDALKRRLTQQGIEVCKKRCVRVLAKFGGDVDKALAALERCHERRQLRLLAGNNRKCPDPAKLEALHQQREARRAERLATRLARQEQKKQLRQASNDINDESAAKAKVDPASAEALVALMAQLGLAVGKGRCTGALRRADGDIDAAKADLVAWCAKRQEHKRNKPNDKTTAAPINDVDQGKLLGQLDQMGFGPSGADDDKAAERIKRRNERLLKRFNGDVAQVAGLLEARKAKVEARIAARKARQGERPRCKRTAAQPTEELGTKAPTAC